MIFESDQAAIEFIKANKTVPPWVTDARSYSADLCALLNGEKFHDLLIEKIETLETKAKQEVRRKYARNVTDFFERLFLPIQNVFSSTGGVKNYQNGDYKFTEEKQKKLLGFISNVRDGKSIERYIESQWINRYHDDPAGVQWMRYSTDTKDGVTSIYPTYHGIATIRTYAAKGQLVEVILFEPLPTKIIDKTGNITADGSQTWVIVDDECQRTVNQKGDDFTLVDDPKKTFKHPFGIVPVIINSDITDKNGVRLSPIHKILPLAKEYARDQSVKTIYKFLQGFPKHGRAGMICKSCHGSKKKGTEPCTDCGGKGEYMKPDVADEMIIPFDDEGKFPTPIKDLMAYFSPDLDTWKQFTAELDYLESKAFNTLWGVEQSEKVVKTATEIHYDKQPQINKLNKYADVAEWIEWKITEWIANAVDNAKEKDKPISLIVYGRRYILEGIDTIQKKYEDAKAAGENAVVLDGIFDELLVVKFKNDPEWMSQELKKAGCEPYLHQSLKEISDILGAEEALRKIYFQRWWKSLSDADLKKDIPSLQTKFEIDFKTYLPKVKIDTPPPTPENKLPITVAI